MPRVPFGLFADIEEDVARRRTRGGRSSVELLDAARLLSRGRIGRRVTTHIVVADDRELLSKALGLFGVCRQDHDRRTERDGRAHTDRERIVGQTLSAPGRCPAPKTCGGRGSIRTMLGSISRTNGKRARDATDAPLVLIARTLG